MPNTTLNSLLSLFKMLGLSGTSPTKKEKMEGWMTKPLFGADSGTVLDNIESKQTAVNQFIACSKRTGATAFGFSRDNAAELLLNIMCNADFINETALKQGNPIWN